MKKFFKILLKFIIIIAILLTIAFGLYIFKIYKEIKSQGKQEYPLAQNNITQKIKLEDTVINKTRKLSEGSAANYWTGTLNPKITIVEFSDFGCPICAQSFMAIRELSIKYKNDIKTIYRDFPLSEFSINLAMGARCAGEQRSFWLMHDKLFQNQNQIKTNEDVLNIAKSINLDIIKFENCINSDKYKQYIQKDFDDASALDIKGTPTWFINGNRIEGNLPMDAWEEIINKIL